MTREYAHIHRCRGQPIDEEPLRKPWTPPAPLGQKMLFVGGSIAVR